MTASFCYNTVKSITTLTRQEQSQFYSALTESQKKTTKTLLGHASTSGTPPRLSIENLTYIREVIRDIKNTSATSLDDRLTAPQNREHSKCDLILRRLWVGVKYLLQPIIYLINLVKLGIRWILEHCFGHLFAPIMQELEEMTVAAEHAEWVRCSTHETPSLLPEDLQSYHLPLRRTIQSILNGHRSQEPATTTPLNLREALLQRGHEPILKNLNLKGIDFTDVNLEGIVFDHCAFKNTHFEGAHLQDVEFFYCDFTFCSFERAHLDHVLFHNCNSDELLMQNVVANDCLFQGCTLEYSSFEEATLDKVDFVHSALPGTHFLQAQVTRSSIEDSRLINALLFETVEQFTLDPISQRSHIQTKPCCFVPYMPRAQGFSVYRLNTQLRDAGLLPFRCNYFPPSCDPAILAEEVTRGIDGVTANADSEQPNIPQAYIAQIKEAPEGQLPASKQILDKARAIARHAEFIALPGGEDLPAKWYGGTTDYPELTDRDDRRALLEFCLLDQAYQKGIPLAGLCRGFHTANVFFGGKIVQNLNGNNIFRTIYPNRQCQHGLTHGLFSDKFVSYAQHHQGVIAPFVNDDEVSIPLINPNGIVEGIEPKANRPWFLFQFHPEFMGVKITRSTFTGYFVDLFLDATLSTRNGKFFHGIAQAAFAVLSKKRNHTLLRQQLQAARTTTG